MHLSHSSFRGLLPAYYEPPLVVGLGCRCARCRERRFTKALHAARAACAELAAAISVMLAVGPSCAPAAGLF